jgi:hypothetical protein
MRSDGGRCGIDDVGVRSVTQLRVAAHLVTAHLVTAHLVTVRMGVHRRQAVAGARMRRRPMLDEGVDGRAQRK